MRTKRLAMAQREMRERWAAKLKRYQQMADGPERVALAVELFGSWSREAVLAHERASARQEQQ